MNLPYYHGQISRMEAEDILEKISVIGSFLIRNSETMSGSYTLCLWAEDGYHQYRVINDDDGLFVKAEAGVEEIKYPSLANLIDYYLNQNGANGLAASLRFPIPVHSMETFYDLKKSTDVKEVMASYFQQKLRLERPDRFNTAFYCLLERYLETGLVSDLKSIQREERCLNEIVHFRAMVFDIMKTLYESVNDVSNKLNFLNSFLGNVNEEDYFTMNLDVISSDKLTENFESMINLSSMLKRVESNILSNLSQRLSQSSGQPVSNGITTSHQITCHPNKVNPTASIESVHNNVTSSTKYFEIEFSNCEHHSLQVHCVTSLNIVEGTMRFELQHSETRLVYKEICLNCDEIDQVMKSENDTQRLLLRQVSAAGYFYIDFSNETKREEFLHCLYGAKRYQEISMKTSTDCLSVFLGTWNIGCTKPTESLERWLKCQGSGRPLLANVGCYVPHDIYVVAIQEDSLDQQWDTLIRSSLTSCFNQDFPLISTKSNSFPKTLKLSIFCRENLERHIKNVTIDVINTGFANKCGNKGAVSISFDYQDASICLINCHLTSGAENAKRREDEFRSILRKLHLSRDWNGHADLLQKYDFVFCMGDLNMRTDGNVSEALHLLHRKQYHVLLQSDELKRYHMIRSHSPFRAFKEPPILHGPTYRYSKGTKDNFNPFKKKIGKPDKVNVPSWCDRVLYKTRNDDSIYPLSYGMNIDNKSSDHKPVFSSFLLALPTRDYLENILPKSTTKFRIDEILLKISDEWRTKRNIRIQIEGTLLNETRISQSPNVIAESSESKVFIAGKSKLKDLIKILDLKNNIALLFIDPYSDIVLKPGLSGRDIESNYLFVSILLSDTKTECIANTVIPLRQFSTTMSHSFEVHLYEHNAIVGSMIIRGALNCTLSDDCDKKYPSARLLNMYTNSYTNESRKSHLRSLFDLLNEQESGDRAPKKFTPLHKDKEESSAFRPIQPDNARTVRNLSTSSNNLPANLSKMNASHFSNTVRIPRTRATYNHHRELQNLSDDSSKYCCNTVSQSKIGGHSNGDETGVKMRKPSHYYDDSALMTVHNESYSATMIRGGVSIKKRNMDARVDLSKLEADMCIIQPPLPPRYSRKNVRPAKTRQEHSNPISMASSSGSSYNANSVGESSIISAEPACCFLNQDLEFEESLSDGEFCKSQEPHHGAHVPRVSSKDAIRTDNSSKQSTITGSSNHTSSGHYVQAITAVVPDEHALDVEKFIEPYASTKILDDTNTLSNSRKSVEIEYVMLQRPLGIRDWLGNLSIPQSCVEKLLNSSFNSLETISNVKEEDLVSLGISDSLCRRKLLDGIVSMLN